MTTTTLAIVSALLGMLLGQRFKVLSLVPAMALALLVAVVTGIAEADALWTIVLTAGACITSLQMGYLVGTGIRRLMALARAGRLPAAALRDQLPAARRAAR